MIDPTLIESYNRTRAFAADKFCYAPFTSLYFGHEGKVVACCENREHLLGIYPQQSIAQIWNGEPARQLRQYITEQNLWHGCKGCDFDLRSGNLEGVHARIFDAPRQRQRNEAYPALLEFEIENTCNLECVMCTGIFSSSIRKNREHLPPIPSSYNAEFVQQLEEFIPHLSQASFFGGEPFLVELYYSIWERMAELNPGMDIWVTTNCTILNNRVKSLLDRLKFNLTLSIDSIEKETYEKIRVNAVFERVMENLEYFLQYTRTKQTDFTVNTCPMPVNWKELPHIIEWGNKKSVLVNVIPVRNPEKSSLRSLSSEKLKEITEYYNSFHFPGKDSFSSRNKKNFEDYRRLVEQWMHYAEEIEKNKTTALDSDPFTALKRKIEIGLQFSSGSIESKESRIESAMKKVVSIQKKLESIDPDLGRAVWSMALHSNVDELLYALFAWGETELLAQSKKETGEAINALRDQSDELTHLKRLRVYFGYLQLTGVPEADCQSALTNWRSSLSALQTSHSKKAGEMLSTLNGNSISRFGDALLAGNEQSILKEWGSIIV